MIATRKILHDSRLKSPPPGVYLYFDDAERFVNYASKTFASWSTPSPNPITPNSNPTTNPSHHLGCGNLSSNCSFTPTFMLISSWTSSFVAYGIVIFVIFLVLLHDWQYPL